MTDQPTTDLEVTLAKGILFEMIGRALTDDYDEQTEDDVYELTVVADGEWGQQAPPRLHVEVGGRINLDDPDDSYLQAGADAHQRALLHFDTFVPAGEEYDWSVVIAGLDALGFRLARTTTTRFWDPKNRHNQVVRQDFLRDKTEVAS